VTILKQNGIPLYVQLEEIFTERIATGEWAVNQTIPNEMALCEEFEVSRGPVRQALDQLVRRGLLRRKQGKGTIVLPPKIENHLSDFYSFTTMIERNHMRPGVKLLAFDVVPAGKNAITHLDLEPEAKVFKLRRLRLANDEPLIIETVYITHSLCPDLTADEVAGSPLYKLLRLRYGVDLVSSKQYFEPALANDFEAEVLGIGKKSPVLLLENITYTLRNRPVVYSKAIMRGDRVRYHVELMAPIEHI